MKLKKILAVLLSLAAVFSLSSCKGNETNFESTTEFAVYETTTKVETVNAVEKTTEKTVSDSQTEAVFVTETSELATIPETSVQTTSSTKSEIVEIYKNAAKKSHSSTKTQQSVEIKKISVNGESEGIFEFISSIMSKFLKNNTEDKDGITGGYNNLTEDDVASAKIYKSGKNTAVEFILKEQVSGAKEDANEGSVGHAITTVGDISVVTNELKDLGLPLETSEENTKIYYTNPTVKVLINENGEIINGTWNYTVEIRLTNYKAFGKDVETTSVIMDNTLTVNGGFNK